MTTKQDFVNSKFTENFRRSILEAQIERANKGKTLYAEQNQDTRFYLDIKLHRERDLRGLTEWLEIKTDLPNCSNFGRYEKDEQPLASFFQQLKQYLLTPLFVWHGQFNRRRNNKRDYYWSYPFRRVTLTFDDINITVGEQAKEYVANLMQKYDITLKLQLKELLKLQKQATPKQQKEFNKFFYLMERKDDLERQIKRESRYSYYSNDDKDYSRKITLSDDDYNRKMKQVEVELTKMKDKYFFIEFPSYWTYDYINTKKVKCEFCKNEIKETDAFQTDNDEVICDSCAEEQNEYDE